MPMKLYGRDIIWTDEPVITKENIIPVLQKALALHTKTEAEIEYLIRYEKGYQPLQRKKEKTYRPDIDFETVDNVAAEAVEFLTSYHFGNPITFVQRGEVDAGKDSKEESVDVALLNECYDAQNINSKLQELGRYVEICGIGYTYVDINSNYEDGDSYFTVDVLNPKFAFVIQSSYYPDHRPMVGVTFRIDDEGMRHVTAFTKDQRFEVEEYKIVNGKEDGTAFANGNRSGELNPLGMIPIIEYIRSYDRMGCFERQIPEMDALNLLLSDTLNCVDQQTQAVWHTNDVDFPEEEVEVENDDGTTSTEMRVKKPESGDWLETYTSPDGKQPFIKPLVMEYDYAGILQNVLNKRSLILQKCGVPERNSANGGSTGVAMSDATGWSAAESSANKQQLIIEAAKMEEVKVVLRAIKKSSDVPPDSPLLKLKYRDVRPNVKRNRSFDLITKSNALATLLSHGVNGLHAFKTVNLFEDNTQVWVDSEEMITKYQKKLFEEQNQETNGKNEAEKVPDRIASDVSDQKDESPVVDGNTQINYSAKNRKG